jgi:hypothetical protein
MKIKLTLLAVVLAALLAPGAGRAVFPYCDPDCANFMLNSGNSCTCPGSAPHFIFTTCGNYPAGCPNQALAAGHGGKEAFLATLTSQQAPTAKPALIPLR